MPTCQAYKCTNTTGRTTKGKSFFKIPEPKNVTERKRAQQWLHNMSMGQDIKTFKFSRNSVLCEDHFHKDVTLGADTFAMKIICEIFAFRGQTFANGPEKFFSRA